MKRLLCLIWGHRNRLVMLDDAVLLQLHPAHPEPGRPYVIYVCERCQHRVRFVEYDEERHGGVTISRTASGRMVMTVR